MIGRNLAHYRVVERIGAGGMGEVWRARDSRLGRDVALKILPPALAADADRMSRFEREARVLASLNHSGIASIYGFERQGDLRFLAMELAEGEDLAQRLARGPLMLDDAIDVACQVADALEDAHARGIVHRDLKPANIKVSQQGKVKILDFGLAKALSSDPENPVALEHSPTIAHETTHAGIILGTAAYMSPEQARGKAVDVRTDVWAFGCVLYEMLTARSAFAGETVSDTIAAVLQLEPDWDALPASVPTGVRRVIRKCLTKDPSRRLHSVADARIELQEATGDAAEIGWPTQRRARPTWILPAVGVAGALLGALAVGVLRSGGRPSPERRVASAPAAHLLLPLPEGGAVMPTPAASAVAISRDSRYVAYVALASSPPIGETTGLSVVSTSMIYLHPLDGSESQPIRGTLGGIAPFFSPDGQWVGFLDSTRGWLRKVPREGGVAVDLCDIAGDIRDAHWLEDGRILFSQGDAGGIQEVSEDGGESRPVTVPDVAAGEKTRRFGEAIPRTDAVVFMLGTTDLTSYDDARIALFMRQTGETRVLLDGGTQPRWSPTGHIVFARGGRLLAVRFDRDALEVRGAPFAVVDEVVTSDGYGSAQYAFSDNGTLVYVRGGPDHYYFQLLVLGLDGRVEALPVARDIYGDARVNPDGNRIVIGVLGANASLWTYDIARGTMTRLTDAWDNWSPLWSPDGNRIAFASNRGGTSGTWIMAADGVGEAVRLGDTGMDGSPNSWSADGRLLSFSQGVDGKAADIWTYSQESDWEETPLISSKYSEYQSAFSPDCRSIAYVSDESGQPEIYVQPIPPTGRKWKLSSDGGGAPVWSPDGRTLYYWKGRSLMMVPVRLEPGFAPERARPVIENVPIADVQFYDIFPDGGRFLVVGRLGDAQDRNSIVTQAGHRRVFPAVEPYINVVTNWFTELEHQP